MSEELKGLEEQQKLIIEKLNYFRKEEIIVSGADRRFELSVRIKESEEKLSKIKIEIRKLREEEFANLRDHLQKIMAFSAKAYTTQDPRQTLGQLLGLVNRLIKLWELAFPGSHIPVGILRNYEEQFDTLVRQNISLSQWRDEIVGHLLVSFLVLAESDLLEALGDKEKRAELEQAASVGVTEQQCLEKACTSFERLSFDRTQRKKFTLLFKAQQHVQYFIHGEPAHGQLWLYNRIIRQHHFFEGDSGIAYYPFQMDGILGDEDMEAALSQKLGVKTPPGEKMNWCTELAARLRKQLQHQHVLFAFKNPALEKLPELNGLIRGITNALDAQSSIVGHKIIFITILERVAEDLDIPCLQPINADILGRWIGAGLEENDEYILEHFDHLPEDDEGQLCEALKEIYGRDHPYVPAEKFIEHVAVNKFGLKWQKCKNQWMRY